MSNSLSVCSRQINSCEAVLDRWLPVNSFQRDADALSEKVRDFFHPALSPEMREFNGWLQDTGNGEWYEQVAVYLAKLPVKAVVNVLSSLRDLISLMVRSAMYAAAHPLKAPLELGKHLVSLAKALSRPEVWTQLGANTLGVSVGYAIVSPVSPIVLAVGGAMLLGGVTAVALKEMLKESEGFSSDKAQQAVIAHLLMGVEAFVTGACFGWTMGALQHIFRGIQVSCQAARHEAAVSSSRNAFAKRAAGEFMARHQFPSCDHFHVGANSAKVYWDMQKAAIVHFPQHVEGASLLMDKICTGHTYREILVRIETVVENGVAVSYPIYQFVCEPIYTQMVGYRLPLTGWVPPLPPPPIPPVTDRCLAGTLVSDYALAARS